MFTHTLNASNVNKQAVINYWSGEAFRLTILYTNEFSTITAVGAPSVSSGVKAPS